MHRPSTSKEPLCVHWLLADVRNGRLCLAGRALCFAGVWPPPVPLRYLLHSDLVWPLCVVVGSRSDCRDKVVSWLLFWNVAPADAKSSRGWNGVSLDFLFVWFFPRFPVVPGFG